jgi:hypothetical protein
MNDVKLIEQEGKHLYETPIGIVPSSTTILSILNKPALGYWMVKTAINYLATKLDDIKDGKLILNADNSYKILQEAKNQHKQIKDESANTGTMVHEVLEFHLKHENVGMLLNDKTKKPFEGFVEWKNKRKFKLVSSEETVWSKHGYAGTLDCAAYLDGKLYIVDFKTSNAIYPEYVMQIASYVKAYEENTGKKIEGAGILRLDKETGEPEWVEFTMEQVEHAFKKFSCILEYYKLCEHEANNARPTNM